MKLFATPQFAPAVQEKNKKTVRSQMGWPGEWFPCSHFLPVCDVEIREQGGGEALPKFASNRGFENSCRSKPTLVSQMILKNVEAKHPSQCASYRVLASPGWLDEINVGFRVFTIFIFSRNQKFHICANWTFVCCRLQHCKEIATPCWQAGLDVNS
jgi:hypothetical protein